MLTSAMTFQVRIQHEQYAIDHAMDYMGLALTLIVALATAPLLCIMLRMLWYSTC